MNVSLRVSHGVCLVRRVSVALFCSALWLGTGIHAADTAGGRIGPGAVLDSLVVGKTTYEHVQVRSITARTVTFMHAGGLASAKLRDLSPELQTRFGYDPAAEQAQEEAAKASQAAALKQQQARLDALRKQRQAQQRLEGGSKMDQLMRSFGQAPELAKEIDLRSRYNELGLWVKDQGYRPSCAVFAIVGALEFQSAELSGQPERFSEEYLIWATRKTLSRPAPAAGNPAAASSESDDPRQKDEGFALEEVVTALRSYGIPARDLMMNHRGGPTADPSDDVIAAARTSRKVSVHLVPGRDGATLIANVVHALNAGVPVPVGIEWPKVSNWRTGYLNDPTPNQNRGHAVTLVGYKSDTGKIEDAVFTFKNSWGVEWGTAGYGTATYRYLVNNLKTAVVLEVEPAS